MRTSAIAAARTFEHDTYVVAVEGDEDDDEGGNLDNASMGVDDGDSDAGDGDGDDI